MMSATTKGMAQRRASKLGRHISLNPCNAGDSNSQSSYTYTYTYDGDDEDRNADFGDAGQTNESVREEPSPTKDLLYDTDNGKRAATHWNGWGYADTQFQLDASEQLEISGNRYPFLFDGQKNGSRKFPEFVDWAIERLGIDVDQPLQQVDSPPGQLFHEPFIANGFLEELSKTCILDITPFAKDDAAPHVPQNSSAENGSLSVLLDGVSRLRRSHGHTLSEVYDLRTGNPDAYRDIPDMVLLPQTQEQVVCIVRAATGCGNVTIIPFGGGTTVTQAVKVPTLPSRASRTRSVVCVDLRRLNRILWIDQESMTACIQAGIYGLDLENQLGALGLTMGHEPDSIEFSTLGGWIATNSSGMKKNRYGNIDDIVISIEMVTSTGIMKQKYYVERQAVGPRMNRLALGSEGCLGIVVSAIVRLRRKPECTVHGSMVFPTFEHGVHAMREIALHRAAPASVRLLDNTQFGMGQKLKPSATGSKLINSVVESAKKFYITEYHSMDPEQLCAMTLLFEGTRSQVAMQQRQITQICKRHGGVSGDATSGLRGYNLTWMIAYLRDFGLGYRFLSESFETSVEWGKVMDVYQGVLGNIRECCKSLGVESEPLVGGRVTQTYDSCAVIYFYFGFMATGLDNPLETFARVEDSARETILRNGGSLSHHHGVGKLRKNFVTNVFSKEEQLAFAKLKSMLDPSNVFGAGNFTWNSNI